MSKLSPNYGNAVVQLSDEGTKKHGNIIIPDTGKEVGRVGIIKAIEKIYNFNTDTYIDSKFEVGDEVLFPPMSGQIHKMDGEEFVVVGINDLLAKITK